MLRNRNRRNRNFLPLRNRNRNSNLTDTVSNWVRYLISFISTFFSFTFYNKFDEAYQYFPLNRKNSYGSATLVLCRLLLRNITYVMQRNSVFYTKRYQGYHNNFFHPQLNRVSKFWSVNQEKWLPVFEMINLGILVLRWTDNWVE